MIVNVLLYEVGKDSEGIHSLELNGKTIVLMFEDKDDAERYCGLLEAQDFPCPSVVNIEKEEIEAFCEQAGYEPRLVECGFVPKTNEDKLSLVPPEKNRDISNWQEDKQIQIDNQGSDLDLESARQRLEDLL